MAEGRPSVLVWNGRVARVTTRERKPDSPGRRECAQAPQHDVLSEDERRRLLSNEALQRSLAD